ncbi:MAG: pyridoxal phosphate-dependent aminotransferase [Dehalococcoidia bacterium]
MTIQRVVHGGVTAAERAAAAAGGIELVDLSASLNPYGPHPAVLRAARSAPLDRYPEAAADTLRAAWASAHGLYPAQVLAANGSSELIYLVARAFASAGRCLVVGPTFGEYAAAARAADASVTEVRSTAGDGFRLRLGDLLDLVSRTRPGLLFLCNPNNPTGQLVAPESVEALATALHANGGRLVIDEAYMDFAEAEPGHPRPGVLVLRSLTKLHRVPGLRLGFLSGCNEDIRAVQLLQPWSVSGPATAAGLAALREARFVAESVRRTGETRMALEEGLRRIGLDVVPGSANFVLVHVGEGAAFRAALLKRGFAVRDCTSFQLPGHVRIAVPRDDQLPALLRAIEEVGV